MPLPPLLRSALPILEKKPEERGFAQLRLFEEAQRRLLPNGAYTLELFRGDADAERDTWLSEGKHLRISIRLCSTKIYSNEHLHCLMTWRDHAEPEVVAAAKSLLKQPFLLLMCVFEELMAVVFAIFEVCGEDKPQLVEQTYATLVFVLGEANKNINAPFKRRIQHWIEDKFQCGGVWRTLALQQV